MILFVVPVVLGILAAFYITGNLIVNEPDSYRRVAIYLTFLATDVTAVALAYLLLTPNIELVLFTFTFTKCLIWSTMDKHAMVHANASEE